MSYAIVVEETGGPEQLRWQEHDVPEPQADQVRVALAAAGVNFIDVYFRTGQYPRPLPFVAGMEGAGVIERIGPDVDGFAEGDRVSWTSVPGSYAERLNVPVASLVKVPDHVSNEQAAAVMLQGMTAHYLVTDTFAAAEGDTALVHAAAGGVGLLLIQMLSRLGVRVIGTCSTVEKEALAREAGAEAVIRYSETDFVPRVAELTDGRGCDVVYDSVGRSTFDGSLQCLRPRGMLALYGQSSGAVPPFDLQQLNARGSLFVTRPSLAHYMATRVEFELRSSAVLDSVAAGELKVRIGATFPLARAEDAHRALEGRETTGKVLLLP
jgi:NADPH2:quinone reductase